MAGLPSRVLRTTVLPTLVALGSCTLALDYHQCDQDFHCANENSTGLQMICVDHECVDLPSFEMFACTSNHECIDRYLNENLVCGVDEHCVDLTETGCGVWRDANTTDLDQVAYIGSILATSAPYDADFQPIEEAVELAVRHYDEQARLPDGRSVGWVYCDSAATPTIAAEHALHLASAGIEAIVGPSFTESVLYVHEQTRSEDVWLITPTATGNALSDLDDRGLVWRTISSNLFQGAAIAQRLVDTNARQVLILTKHDAYGDDLRATLTERLQTELPQANVAALRYANPTTLGDVASIQAEFEQVITLGLPHLADTVVVAGTREVDTLIPMYIQAWLNLGDDPAEQLRTMPRFIVSHGGVGAMASIAASELLPPEAVSVVVEQLEGVSPLTQDDDNFSAFARAYAETFNTVDVNPGAGLGYDATMIALLAVAVSPNAERSGEDIVSTLPRFFDPNGIDIPFRDTFIENAQTRLLNGESVHLRGVSGTLDFDLTTGEVRTDLIGWTLAPTGAPSEYGVQPVRRFALDADAIAGTWSELR